MNITIPELSLVMLIGASGSGKSSFARTHFKPTEILSSDFFRGLVSDNENDQAATKDAFEALHFVLRKRLARGQLTVIDATNVRPEDCKVFLGIAREFHVLPVAIVLDLPEAICLERNRSRPDRDFGPQGEERQVRVWFDWMPGLVVGAEANGWFSELLAAPVRLVWMPEHSERRMNLEFGPSRLSFADGNPFHLVSESSVADLEARVGAAVGVERFRPNLVVRGAQAYAEDRWRCLTFGSLKFKLHEPCARCMVINLEPTTGQIGVEPLRTLARYRRQGKSVLFGQHLHTSGHGLLRAGQRGMFSVGP